MSKALSTLIVDDDGLMRAYLRTILHEIEIFQVDEAGSGSALMRHLQSHQPDLILLDINLPGKNGVELLKEVHSDYSDIKVIMISAEITSERLQECLQHGAAGFIVKPFNASVVIKTIERVLGK